MFRRRFISSLLLPTHLSGTGATTSRAPVAAAALALFVAFEFLRAVHTHSIVLAMFGLLDVVIIVLVLREYRTLRARRRSAE